MVNSYKKFWNNLIDFSGRANRPDYWWPIIINYVLGILIVLFGISLVTILENFTGMKITGNIYSFASILSAILIYIISIIIWLVTLSLKVRRLHDTDRSGWWVLIEFIPIIGTIWFFILMLLPSKDSHWV
ncbi:DUF805 domain-containing protein [Companilactobacillus metriopterae]|uniref:DUF805 domain-containing protein n=1 Tax=Companilactobacillus metriopterae TaxID=1909267 RepID=UPI00100BE625|nr:DUF805 domain-containing protein [Companilactobacillus metriopterae]